MFFFCPFVSLRGAPAVSAPVAACGGMDGVVRPAILACPSTCRALSLRTRRVRARTGHVRVCVAHVGVFECVRDATASACARCGVRAARGS